MDLLGYQTYKPIFYYYDFTQKKNIAETLNIEYISAINEVSRYSSNLVDLIKNDSTNPFARRLER